MTLTINQKSYLNLLDEVQVIPKIIENELEYEHYLVVAERLIGKKQKRTAEETTLLRLLVKLIEDYEEQKFALVEWSDLSPSEILKELLEATGQSQSDLVGVISSSTELISAIVNGKREITKEEAKKLGAYFKVSPSLFI